MPDLEVPPAADDRPQAGSSTGLPAFYDDLGATLAEAWRLLERGAADRRSGFHTPVLASLRADGRPAARTVVLRAADPEARILRFHTDRRSRKYREIAAEPRVAMQFYDPGAKVQLRIDGRATVHADDALARQAWTGSRPMSRACYGVAPGPGTEIGRPAEAVIDPVDGGEAGREHFAAVTVDIESIEWLYLAAAGHRRARFRWNSGVVSATWLVP